MNNLILLDRDGTIIKDRNYISSPDDVELIEGSGQAISNLKKLGFKVVVVTNQSGIGRGLFKEEDYYAVNNKLDELLYKFNAGIDAYYFCPHNPDSNYKCLCRKPGTALFEDIKKIYKVKFQYSWVIGDKMSDMNFAKNIGLKSILVKTGYGRNYLDYEGLIMENLFYASKLIMNKFYKNS